jgi:hypothetical protein
VGDWYGFSAVLNGSANFHISACIRSPGTIGAANEIWIEFIEILQCIQKRLNGLVAFRRKDLKRKTHSFLHNIGYFQAKTSLIILLSFTKNEIVIILNTDSPKGHGTKFLNNSRSIIKISITFIK